jgi:fatty-acyl-CoA synthase
VTVTVPPPSRAALSPISYLLRSAEVWADRPAVRDGDLALTYADLLAAVERLAGALAAAGVGEGDRVAAMLPNIAEMLQLHFAVPGLGAVLVPLNTRLAAPEVAYILGHSGARTLITHPSLRGTAERAVAELDHPVDLLVTGDGESLRARAATATPRPVRPPDDEWQLLSINYTSGTTARPKGVMYSHRGAYLHTLGVIAETGLGPRSAYLWTLPMFHCNGWAFTWAVTAAGAEHVCVEAFEPAGAWAAVRERGVTHLCGAPTVLGMLLESPAARPLDRRVRVFVGGAPPSPALLDRARTLGMDVTHLYGLTETYGPITVCAWQPAWDGTPAGEQARLKSRQGVPTVVSERVRVVDDRMRDVPADGHTTGEVVMRGNNVMLGYYRDLEATERAFAGGWFHSGDLAVMHPDGYVELRDRLKDVIISGGENISSIELEHVLQAHPDVLEAAVVGVPDPRWGEVPKAFVVPRPGSTPDPDDLRAWVRARLAHFKTPHHIEYLDDLPKTATGKIQKYRLRAPH